LIIGFILTIITSVMFSGAEHAVGSISRDSIEKLAENDVSGAERMLRVIGNKRRFQLMLQTGRILSVIIGTILLLFALSRLTQPEGMYIWQSAVIGLLISTVAFVTSEGVLSRLVSVGDLDVTVARFASFLYLFHLVLYPLTAVFDLLGEAFIKRNEETPPRRKR
jgi:CBS domain containing-hemolysin-like protein